MRAWTTLKMYVDLTDHFFGFISIREHSCNESPLKLFLACFWSGWGSLWTLSISTDGLRTGTISGKSRRGGSNADILIATLWIVAWKETQVILHAFLSVDGREWELQWVRRLLPRKRTQCFFRKRFSGTQWLFGWDRNTFLFSVIETQPPVAKSSKMMA